MFFLRLTILLIIVLGGLVYLISARIKAEFIKAEEKVPPVFRHQSSAFKAFCQNPPTPQIEQLVELKKKLSKALLIAVLAFVLAILSVVYEQVVKGDDHSTKPLEHASDMSAEHN